MDNEFMEKLESIADFTKPSDNEERFGFSATFLKNSHIPTYIDAKHAIAHNKIMIIDREIVITGSFNFTKAAEKRTLRMC